MDRQIRVNHGVVYPALDELRDIIDQQIVAETESRYDQIQHLLEQVDGATNAQMITAMRMNREKTVLAATTLRKLLTFMENAARAVEREDIHLAAQMGEK